MLGVNTTEGAALESWKFRSRKSGRVLPEVSFGTFELTPMMTAPGPWSLAVLELGEAKLGEVVLTPGDGALLAPGDPQVEVEAHGRAVVAHHIGRG